MSTKNPKEENPKEKNPTEKQNRPTDAFGGPPRGRNTVSYSVLLVALAIFVLVQWTNGDLGKLLGGAGVPAQEATGEPNQVESNQQPPVVEANSGDATPVAQAVATPHPSVTAKATSTKEPKATTTPRPTPAPTATANAPPADRWSDLEPVAYDELPPEAQETIILIDQGGPFPYSRDGIVFQNRERILPSKPQGYYHEYTVITPNSDDRGARRVVTGEEGEIYYSDDHYESFREILR